MLVAMKCRTERGGLFLANESTTWKDIGLYEMGNTLQLGHSGVGYYGADDICLNEQLTIADQVVNIVNTTDWWIGSLGLGNKQTTFTNGEMPSFLSTLGNRNLIPSLSYGYTAGAYYRQ